jgi:uncharacterized repeat protein (TIGR03803 family)
MLRRFRPVGLATAVLLAWACLPAPVRGQGLTALASFNGTNGSNPNGRVTFDASGNLFGTTVNGGPSGFGTVWELAQGSSTITPLASFNGTNGSQPATSGVTFDANGNLFGTATFGGAGFNGSLGSGLGTVWELAKGSSTITPLASFNGTNGQQPVAGVTFDANGNLFGTASNGGASGIGTVWELAKGSSTITPLASFNGTNGAFPNGGVTFDAHGNLFGTASNGGPGFNGPGTGPGTVWELAKGSGTITPLATFDINGDRPLAGVTFDAHGNLFGTAVGEGASGAGTVWELSQGSSTITPLDSFNHTNGAFPIGGVTFDANGNLFGTAQEGGASGNGTVWELAAVPEPSSLVLGVIGCAVAGAAALLKQKRSAWVGRGPHRHAPHRVAPRAPRARAVVTAAAARPAWAGIVYTPLCPL